MPEWLIAITVCSGTAIVIWWAALVVLAIKGLLFHRNERQTLPAVTDEEPPPEDVPTLGPGCGAILLVIFWPMFVGKAVNDWWNTNPDQASHSK